MAGILEDYRTKDTRPISEIALWAVATDRFMSGWGSAPRKSYLAYPLDKLPGGGLERHLGGDDGGFQHRLLDWMEDRTDLLRVRINLKLPRLQDGNHLSIYDVPDRIVDDRKVAGYSNPTTFTVETKE